MCLPSVPSILLYKYYTVVLNLTIYRQNTYNLLTIYENEFSKLYFLFFKCRNLAKTGKNSKILQIFRPNSTQQKFISDKDKCFFQFYHDLNQCKNTSPFEIFGFCYFQLYLLCTTGDKQERLCLCSVQSILLYKYYTVVLNLTIYRQNTYNLLTSYENGF